METPQPWRMVTVARGNAWDPDRTRARTLARASRGPAPVAPVEQRSFGRHPGRASDRGVVAVAPDAYASRAYADAAMRDAMAARVRDAWDHVRHVGTYGDRTARAMADAIIAAGDADAACAMRAAAMRRERARTASRAA